MRDVAEHAGVSLSTVSRALRGASGVAPEIRERVLRAAAELSYVVSRNASGLVTGSTGRVAVLVPFLQPWFFGVALPGISTRLRAAGLDMLVYQVGDMRGLGFDNHDLAELLDLSTVEQPVSELGTEAARLVTLVVDDPTGTPHVELPTRLLVRGSTAGPRATSGPAATGPDACTAARGKVPHEKGIS